MTDFKLAEPSPAMAGIQNFQTAQNLASASRAGRHAGQSAAELAKASEQFESLMLNFMIREMRATVPESSLFPQSMAQDIFSGMLDERIAGEMSQHGGIGISRMIFEQLKGLK